MKPKFDLVDLLTSFILGFGVALIIAVLLSA